MVVWRLIVRLYFFGCCLLKELGIQWLTVHVVTIDQSIVKSETGSNTVMILAMVHIVNPITEPKGRILAILSLFLFLLLFLLLCLFLHLKGLGVDLESFFEASAESRVGLRIGN